jgi:hypothetical protein
MKAVGIPAAGPQRWRLFVGNPERSISHERRIRDEPNGMFYPVKIEPRRYRCCVAANPFAARALLGM